MTEHKGWRYETSDNHSDEDVRKIEHLAKRGNWTWPLDYSPYEKMRSTTFKAFVDLRFPTRDTGGPLKDADLISMLYERGFICPK